MSIDRSRVWWTVVRIGRRRSSVHSLIAKKTKVNTNKSVEVLWFLNVNPLVLNDLCRRPKVSMRARGPAELMPWGSTVNWKSLLFVMLSWLSILKNDCSQHWGFITYWHGWLNSNQLLVLNVVSIVARWSDRFKEYRTWCFTRYKTVLYSTSWHASKSSSMIKCCIVHTRQLSIYKFVDYILSRDYILVVVSQNTGHHVTVCWLMPHRLAGAFRPFSAIDSLRAAAWPIFSTSRRGFANTFDLSAENERDEKKLVTIWTAMTMRATMIVSNNSKIVNSSHTIRRHTWKESTSTRVKICETTEALDETNRLGDWRRRTTKYPRFKCHRLYDGP